jgi:predicted aspartyl protease
LWTEQWDRLNATGISSDRILSSSRNFSSISADGKTIIIGRGNDKNSSGGAAWIFRYDGSTWIQFPQKLIPSDGVGFAGFGSSAALSADGNTALIGGTGDNNEAGAAWIFQLNSGIWTQQGGKLVANDYAGQSWQGWSVSLSADGSLACIGAPRNGIDTATGATWFFQKNENGEWKQIGKRIVSNDRIGASTQGTSVALSNNAANLVVGGYSDNRGEGAAWIYVPIPLPIINNFTPSNVTADSTVTILGRYFTDAKGVSFDSVAAKSFRVLSDTVITAIVGEKGASGRIVVTGQLGDTVSKDGFTFIKTPRIKSFSPVSARKYDTVIIKGLYFDSVKSIQFGALNTKGYRIVSDTEMHACVDTGSSGEVKITDGHYASALAGFTFIKSPRIDRFSPASAHTDSIITISGINFTNTTAVRFGAIAARSFTVLSDSLVRAVVDTGASGNIVLTTPYGIATATGFTYTPPPPTITSFYPTSAKTGDTVTLVGNNFTYINSIQIGLYGISWPRSYTIVSSTQIQMVIGEGYSGSIRIFDSFGQGAVADGFTFLEPPTITSFTPSSAFSGTTVTIKGTNLTGTSRVLFGGVQARSFIVDSASQIRAVVDTGATGALTITSPGGVASLTGFTYLTNAVTVPVITSFAPASAVSGTTVTIKGRNFTGTTSVSLGGVRARSFVVDSATQVRAVVDTGATGMISLTTPNGTATATGFTYINPQPTLPAVTSFTPAAAISGTTVTIRGINFTGTTRVSFGGIAARSFIVDSATQIRAVVDTGASGSISIVTPVGTATATGFTYLTNSSTATTPEISSFMPLAAKTGDSVRIAGKNFTGTSDIRFGDTKAKSFRIVADSVLVAIIDTGSTGAVYVTTPSGTVNKTGFYIIPATPTISYAGSLTICPGDTVILQSSNNRYPNAWYKNGVLIPGATAAKIAIADSGTYAVRANNQGYLSNVAADVKVIRGVPPVTGKPGINSYAGDTLVCFTGTLQLNGQPGFGRYRWSNGDTTASLNVTQNTVVSLRVSNAGSECFSNPSVTVRAVKNTAPVPTITKKTDSLIESSISAHYRWLYNNKVLADSSQQLKITQKGIYSVKTSDDALCWNVSDDYVVILNPVAAVSGTNTMELLSFPNPSNGVFSLSVKFEKAMTSVVRITITDAGGIVKWSGKKLLFSDKSLKIPVTSNLTAGIYTVRLEASGEVKTIQIIVQ